MDQQPPRVAIVHDWLVGGGAERVVYELHEMFPDAPIYTAYCSPEWRTKLAPAPVITSYMQHWPLSKLRKFLPALRQHWFSHLKLHNFDLIISSSGNGEAKGIKAPAETPHICYCHSPTHFYWRHYQQYLQSPGFGIFNPLARLGLRALVGPLRRGDYRAAQRPDCLVANSTHIQTDIKRYYNRDSVVIAPPVDTQKFIKPGTKKRTGFVTVGRLVPYKRTDLLITACNQLQLPLTVIGRGPELRNLQRLAGPTITFIPNASDAVVVEQLESAQAFLFAAFEDFGITPVEALAAGTPVIAYKAGGALDYVQPGTNGLFFAKQSVTSLKQALLQFPKETFDHRAIQHSAQVFSTVQFRREMADLVNHALGRAHRG